MSKLIRTSKLILKFDVAVEGIPLTALRLEIDIQTGPPYPPKTTDLQVEKPVPKSAFASYTKSDRREVLCRIQSLQVFAGIDVFLDCLSLRPGKDWKKELGREIHERDIFLLFWSRNAMRSEYVDWEWRTALASKTITGIQPHPLEPVDLAPPPTELVDLQFGTLHEWYISHLRRSEHLNYFRILRHRAAVQFRKFLAKKPLRSGP